MMSRKVFRVITCRALPLLMAAMAMTSCTSWRGIASVPLPIGPGTGTNRMTIYVQMPNTLALNVNSRVRVADVYVGVVSAITLKNWTPTLTLDLQPGLRLPTNTLAKIGQTSLFGSQHVQLDSPADPSTQMLRSGDTIPVQNSSAFPTTERTLASIAIVLRGGGISNLEVIQNEVNNVLGGRGDAIRDFLNKLDTFTAEVNHQTADITRAIDSTNRLLNIIAQQHDILDRLLTELPPLVKHFNETQHLFTDAIEGLGRLSKVTTATFGPSSSDFQKDLALSQRPLKQLTRAAPYLIGALHLMLTNPFPIDNVPKIVRGDYINVSIDIDATLSMLDNNLLTGTGLSGMMRALEQSWGRDPQTMIPDVRYTPNPHDAPGGPLVERGD